MEEYNNFMNNLCYTYRHDFGLLKENEKIDIRNFLEEFVKLYHDNKNNMDVSWNEVYKKYNLFDGTITQLISEIKKFNGDLIHKENRIDLESKIMSCWTIEEDLKTLSLGIKEKNLTIDDISNVLNGVVTLYTLRFEDLFKEFENSLKTNKLNYNLEEKIQDCWSVIDDLKVLSYGVLDKELNNNITQNILNGLTDLYNLKFNILFEQFSQNLKDSVKMKPKF